MADISHEWGGDLALGSGGDLLLANEDTQVRQRILRRLLTNPGDYLWQPTYGAGLAQSVGTPEPGKRIQAIVRQQLRLEPAITQSPPPDVTVSSGPVARFNEIDLTVTYTAAAATSSDTISFSIGA